VTIEETETARKMCMIGYIFHERNLGNYWVKSTNDMNLHELVDIKDMTR